MFRSPRRKPSPPRSLTRRPFSRVDSVSLSDRKRSPAGGGMLSTMATMHNHRQDDPGGDAALVTAANAIRNGLGAALSTLRAPRLRLLPAPPGDPHAAEDAASQIFARAFARLNQCERPPVPRLAFRDRAQHDRRRLPRTKTAERAARRSCERRGPASPDPNRPRSPRKPAPRIARNARTACRPISAGWWSCAWRA